MLLTRLRSPGARLGKRSCRPFRQRLQLQRLLNPWLCNNGRQQHLPASSGSGRFAALALRRQPRFKQRAGTRAAYPPHAAVLAAAGEGQLGVPLYGRHHLVVVAGRQGGQHLDVGGLRKVLCRVRAAGTSRAGVATGVRPDTLTASLGVGLHHLYHALLSLAAYTQALAPHLGAQTQGEGGQVHGAPGGLARGELAEAQQVLRGGGRAARPRARWAGTLKHLGEEHTQS